jgi:hypothetical protein
MQQPLILGDLSLSFSSHESCPRSPLPLTPAPGMLKYIRNYVDETGQGSGGEGGIRTHGTLARTPVFKTGVVVVNYLFLL